MTVLLPPDITQIQRDTNTSSHMLLGLFILGTCDSCLHDNGGILRLSLYGSSPPGELYIDNTHSGSRSWCKYIYTELNSNAHGADCSKSSEALTCWSKTLVSEIFHFWTHCKFCNIKTQEKIKKIKRDVGLTHILSHPCSLLFSSGSPFGAPFPCTTAQQWEGKWVEWVDKC